MNNVIAKRMESPISFSIWMIPLFFLIPFLENIQDYFTFKSFMICCALSLFNLSIALILNLIYYKIETSNFVKSLTKKPSGLIVKSRLNLTGARDYIWIMLYIGISTLVIIVLSGVDIDVSNIDMVWVKVIGVILMIPIIFSVIVYYAFCYSFDIYEDYIQIKIGSLGIKNRKYYLDELDGYYFIGYKDMKQIWIYKKGKRVEKFSSTQAVNFDELISNLPLVYLGEKPPSNFEKFSWDIFGDPSNG